MLFLFTNPYPMLTHKSLKIGSILTINKATNSFLQDLFPTDLSPTFILLQSSLQHPLMLASPVFKKLSSSDLLNSLLYGLYSPSSDHPFLFPSLTPLPPVHTRTYMLLRIRLQFFLCFLLYMVSLDKLTCFHDFNNHLPGDTSQIFVLLA